MKSLSKLKKRILKAAGVALIVIGMAFNMSVGVKNIGGIDVLLSNIEGMARGESYCIMETSNAWGLCMDIGYEEAFCLYYGTGTNLYAPGSPVHDPYWYIYRDCIGTVFIS